MATKVVHVSDLSGEEVDEQELVRLVVLEHPEIGEPATLEILPGEIEGLQEAKQFVRLEWTPPGARRPQAMTVSRDQFDALAKDGDMKAVLIAAITSKHSQGGAPARVRPGGTSGRGKVNYATLEHAGVPHRGRITDAEKELVRGNLEKINKRLRDSGQREIDPNDQAMKERYGL